MTDYEEAMSYLNYCAKEGAVDESDIAGKTKKEIIKYAQNLMDRADYMADLAKEMDS